MSKQLEVTFRYGDVAMPGLFIGGKRISWWPGNLEPYQALVDNVVRAYHMNGRLVTAQQIRVMNDWASEWTWD